MIAFRLFALVLMTAAAGCTTVLTRAPVPGDLVSSAAPYGITSDDSLIRDWGDDLNLNDQGPDILKEYAARQRRHYAAEIAKGGPIKQSFLALSGGGPDGAYSAGLLNGWTARGDRPEFTTVTGISTGAIVALFAFLGPDYDDKLTEVYTTYTTEELIEPTFFSALTGGSAVMDTRGYRALIERYVDDEVMRRLAAAAEDGRALLIGTTNLDAARPVIWSLGNIAATGHPDAEKLIEDVIQASSAIPAVFPPVLIPVVGEDGRRYDEMHVDGGATQQVMLFSPEFPFRRIDKAVGVRYDRELYVVINNKLEKPYNPVRPRLVSIAGTAASSLLGGSGTSDVYKIYAIANRDGIDLNLLAIPRDFDEEPSEPFDPVYMKALYDLGYKTGLAGDQWSDRPPDFVLE